MSILSNVNEIFKKLQSQPAYRNSVVFLNDILRVDIFKQASAMAYSTLLSIIPSLAVIFVLVSLFIPLLDTDGKLFNLFKDFVLKNLSQGAGQQLTTYLDQMISSLNIKKIGVSSFIGLVMVLILLLRQIELAFNHIWLIEKERNLFTRFTRFWTFLTLGSFVLFAGFYSLSGFDFQWDNIISQFSENRSQNLGQYITQVLSSWLIIFLLFKIVPNCKVRNFSAIYGALVTAISFQIVGGVFTSYIKSFSNYQLVYGALAILPIFLLWLYLSWFILLTGALFSWRLQVGFPQISARQHHKDFYAEHHLRSLLPLFVLIELYEHQQNSDYGLRLPHLLKKLELPQVWLEEALNSLINKKLVLLANTNEYHPALLPDRLNLARLVKDVVHPLTEWEDSKYIKALKVIQTYSESELQKQTMQDLINLHE